MDNIIKLAKHLVEVACDVKKNNLVYIDLSGDYCELVSSVIEEVYAKGAIPYLNLSGNNKIKALCKLGNEDLSNKALNLWAKHDADLIRRADWFIEILNDDMLANLDSDVVLQYKEQYYHTAHWETRMSEKVKTRSSKWVTVRNPNKYVYAHGQYKGKESDDLVWKAYGADYEKMKADCEPLIKLLENTDNVRIISVGTDITINIKNQPVVGCFGEINMPDGEIFIGPVKDKINGKIKFNMPAWYMNEKFEYISFSIVDGKVVNASSDNDFIYNILEIDQGARYFGEFAFGVNPNIDRPIGNIIFDEKIFGSIHLALGNCYASSPNGNSSAIHWDLILDLRKNGKIFFDNKLIFDNGKYLI